MAKSFLIKRRAESHLAEPQTGLVRTIGRWSLAALMVNTMVGASIFGLPALIAARLGRLSPVGSSWLSRSLPPSPDAWPKSLLNSRKPAGRISTHELPSDAFLQFKTAG